MTCAPVGSERTEDFSAPPEVLWEIVANTEHMNRRLDLPAIRYGAPVRTADGFYRPGETRVAGLRVRLEEAPFEWVRTEWYEAHRKFLDGPIAEMTLRVEISPAAGGGSRLRVSAGYAPRRPLFRGLAGFLGARTAKAILGYCRRAVAEEKREFPNAAALPPPPSRALVDRARLTAAAARLRREPIAADCADRLLRHVETASDEEVLGMRPFALADRWAADRGAALRTFLHGTRTGLLEMEWQLLCPACRTPNVSYRSLAELEPGYRCDFCQTDHRADLDRTTELRFNVAPAIRPARREIYCAGNPTQFFHVLVQQFLRPGETRRVRLRVPGERLPLRLRVLQDNHVRRLDEDDPGDAPRRYAWDGSGWSGPGAWLPAGPVELTLENRGLLAAVMVLERLAWDEAAVTAARVTTMAEFRAHFGAEVLAPGREIAVRHVALLFTDLKASTALYEQVGDAPAFGRVQRHFDFLTGIVAAHGGTRVKTIGDAVMAAFHDPANALRAAFLIQAGIDSFNREHGFEPPVVVKIGVHGGPAIAINANGQMDYFGRTVNLAARIQNESGGGDIVCLESFLAEPGIAAVLGEFQPQREPFRATVRGIAESLTLCRLR